METKEPPESTSGPEPIDDELITEPDPESAPETPAPEPQNSEGSNPEAGEPEEFEEALEAPPVVAVMVTTGGPFLDAAIASLAAQDYPALSVLVLDNASDADPTARIATEMPTAFVRRLPENIGFAAAANQALTTVEGATFLVFCHDDIALDPDAIRVMVEEAYRSNAAIVGPKLVDYADPDVLIEVGMAIDHYGVPFSGIEPGEIDQEQHDGVRDVFFVSHATMLVRADLFRELGGFDVAAAPGSDDIDLCWRARLVGARVLVAPSARVRHRRATAVDERRMRRQSPEEARLATKARVRVLIKSYSWTALVWVLPSAFALSFGEAVALALTRRWRHALAAMRGWFPSRGTGLGQARASTQRSRQVDDADVRDLMIRGSARIRGPLVQRLHAGDRLAVASNRARVRMSTTGARLRRAPGILALVVVALIVVGSRGLVFGRVPEIGAFRAWPGIGALWHTFTTPWRTTMLGSQTPGTPAYALMAGLTTLTIGHAGLARTIVVAGAIPLGMVGSFRLARKLTASSLPSVVTAVAYVTNPVGRDAIAKGDLGPLVMYALAPFVLLLLVRAVTSSADATMSGSRWRRPVHTVLGLGVLGAIAGSVWPPAILLLALVAIVFVLSAALTGAVREAVAGAALAIVGGLISVALLIPWSLSLIGADAETLGLHTGSSMTAGDVLRFEGGPSHTGWFTLGLVVAAVVPLLFASGPRFVWATRAWLLALSSFALAWVPTRISATLPVPAVEGVLVPAALGLAVAAGLGVSALLDDMRRAHFGWRQVAAVAAALGIALPVLALAVDTTSGRWHLPADDWPTAVSWMSDVPTPGGFRVLWLGAPSLLPVDGKVLGGTTLADAGSGNIGFALSRNGPGDARALWAAPEAKADDVLEQALLTVRAGDSARLGHLLAPAGIRYVVVLSQTGAGDGAVVPVDATLADAMTRQLDLSISRIDTGAIVYANDAWFPSRAIVPAGSKVRVEADAGEALAAAARSDAAADARGVGGDVGHSRAIGPGTLLWAEAADSGWHATANGKGLARSKAFDWTNAFELTDHTPVGLHFGAGALPGYLIEIEIVAWIVVLVGWRRTRARVSRRRDREVTS
jgi:GT2 family glycosyltransferase